MVKKFPIILTAIMVLAMMFQTGVMAAVIEIDTKSPDFKVESYQNKTSSDEVCPLENVTATTPIATAAGVTNAEIKRFSTSLKIGEADVAGDPQVTLLDGRATINPVFPFKETTMLESFSLKFNNGTRQYFFIAYVSKDGKTWTEVPVSGAAKKVTITATYGAAGAVDGKGIDCYATTPAGTADNKDVNVITVKLDKPTEAKYLKLTFFGNDNGTGSLAVAHAWVSFNSFKVEGSAVAAATTTTTTTTKTPDASAKTGDSSILILTAAAMSIAIVTVLKKKKV